MRKIGWMMALACVMALPCAVAAMVTIFAAHASAQVFSTVSKSCGSCHKPVSITAKVGDVCPHCGVRWGYENTTTIPSIPSAPSAPAGRSAEEVYAKKMADVWKQTDQMKLADLALEDQDADIRRAAAGRLRYQVFFRRVVVESKDADVRVIAVWKLDDPTVLASVAKSDADVAVRQAATNRQAVKIQKVDLGGGVQMELVLIAPGSFKMGSKRGQAEEKPVHEAKITEPFYMGKYEVTQEQWEKVMGSNPSSVKEPKNPVTDVSWDDCQVFLRKLNERTGGNSFFLPTEAQWEYACRAGSASKYFWGDDAGALGEYAWCHDNSGGNPHPVGERKPNAWGLYDMSGNVWEWCADWYDGTYYRNAPSLNPTGPASGSARVWRGGSWLNDDDNSFRCASRSYDGPSNRFAGNGFRCARTP